MLDNILNLVKEVASDTINKSLDVPSDKKGLAINTATESITSGLTSNLSALTSLLGGGETKSSSNPIMDMIQKTLVNSLAEKVGISPAIANGLAASILPSVLAGLTSKLGSEKGFSVESVIGALGAVAGGNDNKKSGGGLLGALGKLFS